MARKHKGKSRRRIKDWQERVDAGRDIEAGATRQRLNRQEVKLGQERFAAVGDDDRADWQAVEGLVTGLFRRGGFIRVDRDGQHEELFCSLAKTFRPPEGFDNRSPLAVGDEVTVALVPEDHHDGQVELDRNRIDGMVLSRRPRRALLARPQPRSGKRRGEYDEQPFIKVIAANMDQLLLVAAVEQPKLKPGLIDRFRIVAERGDLPLLLAVNKIDLARPEEKLLADLAELGVEVVRTSAETGEGLDELRQRLAGKRSVLGGASGVGKTTLVNALVPHADAATRSVRHKDQRGRHTTTQARIYDLPAGGMLVDTPGLRELDVGLSARELPWYFPEIEALAPDCRFNDCTHTHEPACAVRAAVEAGEIPARRYNSYLRLLDSATQR